MPTTKSAAKRLRQSLQNRAQNRAVRSAVKTQIKKVRAAVAEGDFAKADTEFKTAAKKLDRAGVKRYIHANAASRTKSRLSHLIKTSKIAAKTAPPPVEKPKAKPKAKKKS